LRSNLQKTGLSGQPYDKLWLEHADLARGVGWSLSWAPRRKKSSVQLHRQRLLHLRLVIAYGLH